jgi:hypothetical protein
MRRIDLRLLIDPDLLQDRHLLIASGAKQWERGEWLLA